MTFVVWAVLLDVLLSKDFIVFSSTFCKLSISSFSFIILGVANYLSSAKCLFMVMIAINYDIVVRIVANMDC